MAATRLLLLLAAALLACAASAELRIAGAAQRSGGASPIARAGTQRAAAPPQCSLQVPLGGELPHSTRLAVDVQSGGKARTFMLRLPPDYAAQANPLLLAVHGAFQSAQIFLDTNAGADEAVHIDHKASGAGFVVLAPNSLCETPLQLDTCRWADTETVLDPSFVPDQGLPQQSELQFFLDAAACVRDVLGVPLSGDVYALGFSQGAKLVSRFACAGATLSGGALRLRAVAAAEAFYASREQYPTCAAALGGSTAPPPMLMFQAQQDEVVPFCTPGVAYLGSQYYFNSYANGYNGCTQTAPFGETLQPNSPPIMQALCAPGVTTLLRGNSSAATTAAAADETRLLRVYTNGVGCTSPLALFWLSEAAATGHKWPGPMAALGGRDATDVALQFFDNVRRGGAQLSNADALAPLLAPLGACKTQVAVSMLLPGGFGLSAGPCRDLETPAVPEVPVFSG